MFDRNPEMTLETLISHSATQHYVGEGMRLKLVKQAQKQIWVRKEKRNQIASSVLAVLLMLVTGWQLRDVELQLPQNPLRMPQFCMSELEVSGEEIGEWGHIDAMLAMRERIAQPLLHPRKAS